MKNFKLCFFVFTLFLGSVHTINAQTVIVNESFTTNYTDWGMYAADPAVIVTPSLANGQLNLAITNPSGTNWFAGIQKQGIALTAGDYKLTFDAKANTNKELIVFLAKNYGDWATLATKSAVVSTSLVAYTLNFSLTSDDANTRLFFGTGNFSQFTIDNIKLESINEISTKISKISISSTNSQKMEHWGIWGADNRLDWGDDYIISNHPEVCDTLFKGLGADLVRIDLTSSCYNSTKNALDPLYLEQLKKHILSFYTRGIANYFVSIWTPPFSMKDPASSNGNVNGVKARLRVDKEDEFVKFVVDAMSWLKANNCPIPIALSIQNEPDFDAPYDGCVYDAAQYARVVKKMYQALLSKNLKIMLAAPEGGSLLSSTELINLTADPDLDKAVGVLAAHSYNFNYYHNEWLGAWPEYNLNGTFNWPLYLDKYIKATALKTQPKWMTEWCAMEMPKIATPYDALLTEMRHFNGDMTHLNFTTWIRWSSWSKNNPTSNFLLLHGDPIERRDAYFVFQKIFKSAKPGSFVKKVTSDDVELNGSNKLSPDIDMLAFENESKMVVILVNPMNKIKQVEIDGLVGKSCEIFRVKQTEKFGSKGISLINAGTFKTNLDPYSINILVTDKQTILANNETQDQSLITPIVYPVPCHDELTIKFKDTEFNAELFDIQGNVCKKVAGVNNSTMDLKSLKAGSYVLTIKNSVGNSYSKKIVVY